MRHARARAGLVVAALLCALPVAAQSMEGTPQGAEGRREARRPAAAPRVGFGGDNDAQRGGVPGNAPFNNQLRKFTDPLGANGGK